MNIAFLFPGQGSQRPGMLHRLPDTAASATVLAEADVALRNLAMPAGPGAPPSVYPAGIAELDTELGLQTSQAAVHVALFIAGVAGAQALVEDEEVQPALVAGHGAGGYAAAVLAGVLTFEEALAAVHLRGALQESGQPESTAAVRLAQHLATIPRRPQSLACVSSVHGRCLRDDTGGVFDDLAQSVAYSGRRAELPAALAAEGVECAVEMPPGRVLTERVTEYAPSVRAVSVEEHGIAEAAELVLGGVRRRRDEAVERELGEQVGWGHSGLT